MDLFDANSAKASFDDIYVKLDPRAYFSVLGSLDYSIPDLARPIVRQIADAWRRIHERDATLLDLGSSYGINAALHRFPLTFDMLRRRYARRAMLELTPAEINGLDRQYFQAWPRVREEKLVVTDISVPAVNYAVTAGIADAGIAGSFEDKAPSADAAVALADVDIIMSTGCVGYVTERSFENLIDVMRRPPWVVSFVLRMFDYEAVAQSLAKRGLITEKLDSAAFVQRRFHSSQEANAVLELLERRGIDATGLEAEGLLFAELYLSRPAEDVAVGRLEEIVTVASGRNINFGPRLIRIDEGEDSSLASIRI